MNSSVWSFMHGVMTRISFLWCSMRAFRMYDVCSALQVDEVQDKHFERWTLFFDRLPLVLKCYHEPKGTGSGFKPATGVVFSAAMSARACS